MKNNQMLVSYSEDNQKIGQMNNPKLSEGGIY